MTRAIIMHLGKVDPVMKQLIAAAGRYAREPQEERSPFETLARAIAHQQLNGKAAQSILNRFISTCGRVSSRVPPCCSRWKMRSCALLDFIFKDRRTARSGRQNLERRRTDP